MPFRCCELVCLGVGIGCLLLAAVFIGIGSWSVQDGREFDSDSSKETCVVVQSDYIGRCDADDGGWGWDREYRIRVSTTKCVNNLERKSCLGSRDDWKASVNRAYECWVHDNCREVRFEDPLVTHIGGWVMIALGIGAVIAGIILIVLACQRAKSNGEEVSVTEPYTAPVGAPNGPQGQQGAPVQGVPIAQQPYPQQQQYPQQYQQYPQQNQQYPQQNQQYPQQQQPYPQQYQQPYQQRDEPGAPPTK